MSQSINAGAIGLLLLEVNGVRYACTAVNMNMAINSIPSAVVTIGCGARIKNKGKAKQSPEDLYKEVLDNRRAFSTEYEKAAMIPCTIIERIEVGKESKSTVVFKGVIASASPVYKAGTTTTKMIQFTCVNAAAELYTNPVAAYKTMQSSAFISAMSDPRKLADEFSDNALNISNAFGSDRSIDNLLDALPKYIQNESEGTVLDRFDACLAAVMEAASSRGDVDPSKISFGLLKKYMHSSWCPNPGLPDSCRREYTKMLLSYLVRIMGNASIYQAVEQLATSADYMLNLVPRWDAGASKDFKLDMCPTRAWETIPSITLYADEITGIQPSSSVLESIDTPNAFMVNYSKPVSYGGTGPAVRTMVGAFSPIKEIQDWLDSEKQVSGESKMTKAKLYDAPKWLYPSINGTTDNKRKSGIKSDASVATEKIPAVRKSSAEVADPAGSALLDIPQTVKTANKIAKALYVFLYGMTDTATIRLSPDLRFGHKTGKFLENSIGMVIDVKVGETSEGRELEDSVLDIRGMLDSITYSYTCGESSSASYSITLSRVRPLDPSETPIDNPMYVNKAKT